MLKFKGEMLRDIQREKRGDDGRVVLQHQSSFWCVISQGCNWWKKFRRPFQNKVGFGNTPNFLRHGSSSLECRVRRGTFKSIMEPRLLPAPLLSSFSLPTCQVIPTLRLLLWQAASFLWALQIWLGWQPYAMRLQEPVKKTPSVLKWHSVQEAELAVIFFVFLAEALPHHSHHRGPWKKGCEGQEHVRKKKVLQAGHHLMLLLKYSEKEKGIFLQQPLVFYFLKLDLSGFQVWEPLDAY